jgi:hypothetical protein
MKQIVIPFRGWDLIAWANTQPADARIAIKPICDHIGIAWTGQYQKLTNDPRFNCEDIVMVAEDGKQRPMTTLPVIQLNGWLFGINPNKVKPEIVQYLTQFQQFCFQAIYDAISGSANANVVARMQQQMDELMAQVAYLTKALAETQRELTDTKRQLIKSHNQFVSDSARDLRLGHLKN